VREGVAPFRNWVPGISPQNGLRILYEKWSIWGKIALCFDFKKCNFDPNFWSQMFF